MTSPMGLAALGGATPAYIEDVFSTYLYTGNGSIQTIPNGIALGSDSGGSVYFPNFPYLTAAPNAALNLTGNFTIECFFRATSFASPDQSLISQSSDLTNYVSLRLQNEQLSFFSSNGSRILDGGAMLLDTWYHVAVTRSSTTTRLFVNGVLRQSTTAAIVLYDNFPWAIGARTYPGNEREYFSGFISNVRIVKDTAVYTANFTPPTSPLTATANTSLLTCRTPNVLLDYSSNAFVITNTNSAIAQNGGGPFTDSTANRGGMVWIRDRLVAADYVIYDTARGPTFDISSNTANAQTTQATGLTSFNSNGFTVGALGTVNTNGSNLIAWSFRKQPKFFDVLTYTGTGANRTVAHNLGAVPGCIMIKRTDTGTSNWAVYHRDLANTEYLILNSPGAKQTAATTFWNSTTPTATEFSLGTAAAVNASGGTYVAYLFAHNAGGFGISGQENVITCGSYTGNGSATGPEVNLGFEPQWVLVKNTGPASSWAVHNDMTGGMVSSAVNSRYLLPSGTTVEAAAASVEIRPNGFGLVSAGNTTWNQNGAVYIYIAIRRGPMRTPTSGTSVFGLNARTGTGVNATVTGGAGVTDLAIIKNRGSAIAWLWGSRVTGVRYIESSSNNAEGAAGATILQAIPWDVMDGVKVGTTSTTTNASAATFINYLLRRAPGFFDIVCDTGVTGAKSVNHNLGVVPELMIRKKRNSATNSDWVVWHSSFSGTGNYLLLNTTDAVTSNTAFWTSTPPTATVFNLGTGSRVNNLNDTYITFLFASVPGVSKIGSYTGNGTSQTINCGFTTGARFILIKRTDLGTANWNVYDTARGIIAGNDPRLLINATAAEVGTDDSIDPDSSGFIVNQVAATNLNVNAAAYIFLAIA